MLMGSLLFSLLPLSCNELCAQVTNSNYIITISGEETLMRVDRGRFFLLCSGDGEPSQQSGRHFSLSLFMSHFLLGVEMRPPSPS